MGNKFLADMSSNEFFSCFQVCRTQHHLWLKTFLIWTSDFVTWRYKVLTRQITLATTCSRSRVPLSDLSLLWPLAKHSPFVQFTTRLSSICSKISGLQATTSSLTDDFSDVEIRVIDLEMETASQADDIDTNTQNIEGTSCLCVAELQSHMGSSHLDSSSRLTCENDCIQGCWQQTWMRESLLWKRLEMEGLEMVRVEMTMKTYFIHAFVVLGGVVEYL